MKLGIVMSIAAASLLTVGCGSSGSNNASTEKAKEINTVNTHNTAPIGDIQPWDNLNAGVRCVRTVTTPMEGMPTERFMAMSMSGQIVMVDTMKGIEWVNGKEADAPAEVDHGCKPVGPGKTEDEIKVLAENFCSALVFATHDDWRVPTDLEHQEFIVQMANAGKVPFYANPACPRVVGSDTGSI